VRCTTVYRLDLLKLDLLEKRLHGTLRHGCHHNTKRGFVFPDSERWLGSLVMIFPVPFAVVVDDVRDCLLHVDARWLMERVHGGATQLNFMLGDLPHVNDGVALAIHQVHRFFAIFRRDHTTHQRGTNAGLDERERNAIVHKKFLEFVERPRFASKLDASARDCFEILQRCLPKIQCQCWCGFCGSSGGSFLYGVGSSGHGCWRVASGERFFAEIATAKNAEHIQCRSAINHASNRHRSGCKPD
jgi:hypothetical protein